MHTPNVIVLRAGQKFDPILADWAQGHIRVALRKQHHSITCRRAGEVFALIVAHKLAHDGNSPSVRQLAQDAGFRSYSRVAGLLDMLEGVKLIEKQGDGASRYVRVIGGCWRFDGEMPDTLPSDEERVFRAILAYKATHDGNSPTYAELVTLCRFASSSTAHLCVQVLELRRLVRISEAERPRTIEVVDGCWTLADRDGVAESSAHYIALAGA